MGPASLLDLGFESTKNWPKISVGTMFKLNIIHKEHMRNERPREENSR